MGNTQDSGFKSNIDMLKNSIRTKCSKCSEELMFSKSKCGVCTYPFCSKCLYNTPNGTLCFSCKYCGIPEIPPREDELLNERSQDLLWILKHNNISTVGLLEKKDIIAEILKKYYSHHRNRPQQRQYQSTNPVRDTRNNNHNLRNRSSQYSSAFRSHQASTSRVNNEPSIPPPTYSETITTHRREHSEPPITRTVPNEQMSYSERKALRICLQDIEDERQIDSLSVKQLKDILAFNMVDYTGCCERKDLTTHVQELWRSHIDEEKRMKDLEAEELSQTLKDGNDSEKNIPETEKKAPKKDIDADLCKICLSSEANTVFLNCGHVVACVGCGRSLNECPICRKIIVKCIRIFKS